MRMHILAGLVSFVGFGIGVGEALHADVEVVVPSPSVLAPIRSGSTFVDCESSACFEAIAVGDLNGVPGMQCPGCDGDVYRLDGMADAWALLYGGRHHDGTVDCNSDVRWSVAGLGHPDGGYESGNSTVETSYWERFFERYGGVCADEPCGSHFHIFRPSDGDPFTALFMDITGISGFCNGANYDDNDPIRRPCVNNGELAEDVCGPDGTLGLVLPVSMPQGGAPNSDVCEKGAFAWGTVPFDMAPSCEDDGPSIFGLCLIPVDAEGEAGCLNPPDNFNIFTGLNTDTRAVNRVLRDMDGNVVTDDSGMEVRGAYFRLHEAHTVTPGSQTCREATAGSQIDCLIAASGCSTGMALRGAPRLFGTVEVQECGGGVIIDAGINVCPEITYLNVAPLVVGVGGTATLTAEVFDADGDALTHEWGVTAGATIADPLALSTQVTCTLPGSHTLSFTVTDIHECSDDKEIPIICVE